MSAAQAMKLGIGEPFPMTDMRDFLPEWATQAVAEEDPYKDLEDAPKEGT